MKVPEEHNLDLDRWPIGAIVTCGEYKDDEGCGTRYQIERRADWFSKVFPAPYYAYAPATYKRPCARCPNCAIENAIPREESNA